MTGQGQATLFLTYLALIGSLILAMKENNKYRKTPNQIKHEQQYGMNGDGYTSDFDNNNNKNGVYDDYFSNIDGLNENNNNDDDKYW